MLSKLFGGLMGGKKKRKKTIRQLIAESMDKNPSEVTDENFQKLQQLNLDSDLSTEELEKCTELTMLGIIDIDNSEENPGGAEDIERIKKLKKIKKLELIECNFTDLNFLTELPELKTLFLTNCFSDDYSALKELSLSECFVTPRPRFDIDDMPNVNRAKIVQHEKMYALDLANCSWSDDLNFIRLTYCDISKLMINHVENMYTWKVKHLVISYDLANSDDFQVIYQAPESLADLQVLTIDNTFEEDGITKLIKTLHEMRPDVSIGTKGDSGISISMTI